VKQALKPNYMKLLTGAAGILGLSLRAVLYAVGTDQKGLLIEGHWASSGVWLLTAAIALILFLWCRQLTGSRNYQKAFPSSLFCAAGAALAGIGFVLSPTAQAPSPTFANIELVLRFVSAASLIWISYCRFRGESRSSCCTAPCVCIWRCGWCASTASGVPIPRSRIMRSIWVPMWP